MRNRRFSRLVLAAALAAGVARADNLLPNGRFDQAATATAGWVEVDPFGSIDWDGTRDADGCAGSGAAVLVNVAPTAAAAARFATCAAAVVGGADYAFGASLLFPIQDRDGEAFVEVHWLDAAECGGSLVGTAATPSALSTVENQWISLAGAAIAPVATASALVVVTLNKKVAGADLTAFLDEVELRPADELFEDGVDVGAVCRWSAATTE